MRLKYEEQRNNSDRNIMRKVKIFDKVLDWQMK